MFFCEKCRVKNDWPRSAAEWNSVCELCGWLSVCYDIPSVALLSLRETDPPPNEK